MSNVNEVLDALYIFLSVANRAESTQGVTPPARRPLESTYWPLATRDHPVIGP